MLVRWLLKNMNGSSEDAQKLRRYPLTWRILGKVFSSIPLFSLAKSLADRRFVHVLQSALKDASEPKGEAGTKKQFEDMEMEDDARIVEDAEMVGADFDQARPRKKQRAEKLQFDLESQSRIGGCLCTAEALFGAVRLLLARVQSSSTTDGKRHNHMGAEHIKSLFCSPASEIKDMVVPALKICQLAVHNDDAFEDFDGQESWISTIRNVWDLHLQGEDDALQVATHFSPFTIDMHHRLNRFPNNRPWRKDFPSMTYQLERQWQQDLKRLLARSLILPARTAFLNKGDLEIIRLVIQSTSGFSTVSCPVILDQVLSSPSLAGSQTAKRDNDSWIQAVFSLLDETLQSSRSKHRFDAVWNMLKRIDENKVSLSVESLRSVCKNHALQPETTIWRIILKIADISPDVFMAGEGDELFQAVLTRLPLGVDNDRLKSDVISALAAGFARSRNTSGFVKIWFQYLAAAEPDASDIAEGSQYWIWYNDALRQSIAESLEKTMTAKQILSLVDWLDSQADKPAENAAVILIVEALSKGITQDDVTDSVGMRLFEMVSKRSLPLPANNAALACKWTVARRSLQWATIEQCHEIWTALVTDLRDTLTMGSVTEKHVFEAFKFAAAAWVANHPGGKHEDEAANLTLSALSQLDDTAMFLPDDCEEHRVIRYLTDMSGDRSLLHHDYCPPLLR